MEVEVNVTEGRAVVAHLVVLIVVFAGGDCCVLNYSRYCLLCLQLHSPTVFFAIRPCSSTSPLVLSLTDLRKELMNQCSPWAPLNNHHAEGLIIIQS